MGNRSEEEEKRLGLLAEEGIDRDGGDAVPDVGTTNPSTDEDIKILSGNQTI